MQLFSEQKKYFNTSGLNNLDNTFVFPYLIYCVDVWGNALSTHIQPLIKLPNKIVIIITYSFTQNYLSTIIGILLLQILVKHRIGLLMHKLYNGNVPKPLQIYINPIEMSTRQAHHFHSTRGNNEFINRTLHFKVWSSGTNASRI